MKNHLVTITFNTHCNKEQVEFAVKQIAKYSKTCLFNLTNWQTHIIENNNEKKE